jgi:ribosome-associated translation inhibitor RaiA
METSITNLPTFRSNPGTDSNLRAWQAERTAVAAVSNEQHMDVTLVTDEGDKVTLSLDARAAAMYGAYEQAAVDGQGFSAAKGEFSVGLYEREMTFTVEGELSAEEQKDIRKALKTLDRMMHNFVNGDVKPMLAKARKLQGLESLASVEAHMSYERTVLVAQQSQETVEYSPDSQAAAPAVQAPVVPVPAPTDASEEALEKKADAVGGQMAETIAATQTPAERMLAFVGQLLDDYRQQMAAIDPMGGRMIDRVAGQLRDALAQFNRLGESAAPQAA